MPHVLWTALLLGSVSAFAPQARMLSNVPRRGQRYELITALVAESAPAREDQKVSHGLMSAATDSSQFQVSDVALADLLTLASLPLLWSSMLIVTRILTTTVQPDGQMLTPAACVFGTTLLTVPLFAGSLLFQKTTQTCPKTTQTSDASSVDEASDELIGRIVPTSNNLAVDHADSLPSDEARAAAPAATDAESAQLVLQAGAALGGLWMVGGLIQTAGFSAGASASHGAFLTQMTTLIVPLLQVPHAPATPTLPPTPPPPPPTPLPPSTPTPSHPLMTN